MKFLAADPRRLTRRLSRRQKILFISHMLIITIGAAIGSATPTMEYYFNNKKNFLNTVFAKWGVVSISLSFRKIQVRRLTLNLFSIVHRRRRINYISDTKVIV